MAINYPINCKTDQDKLEFCYIAQEALRLDFNAKGLDYREGRITTSAWTTYQKTIFEPLQSAIVKDLIAQKEILKNSTKWIVDLTKVTG